MPAVTLNVTLYSGILSDRSGLFNRKARISETDLQIISPGLAGPAKVVMSLPFNSLSENANRKNDGGILRAYLSSFIGTI